jgi:hypothetical protein
MDGIIGVGLAEGSDDEDFASCHEEGADDKVGSSKLPEKDARVVYGDPPVLNDLAKELFDIFRKPEVRKMEHEYFMQWLGNSEGPAFIYSCQLFLPILLSGRRRFSGGFWRRH